MKSLIVIFAVCFLLAGCGVQLGETSYPQAEIAGVEGVWELRPSTPQASQAAGQRVTLEVRRYDPTVEESKRRYEQTGEAQASLYENRYFVVLRSDGPREEDRFGPIVLEGEFIRTRKWTLFTYQRALSQRDPMDWFGGLAAPVQYTLRVDREGDTATIAQPRVSLVYVPLKMAGTLDFKRPEPESGDDMGVALVQHVDDIFRTLDEAGPEDWRPVGTAVRVK